MRRILQAIAVPLLISCSFAGVARAQEITPRCPEPSSTVLLGLMARAPDIVILELRGNQAKTAIKIFNQLPPASEERGDRFYIAFVPGISVSRLLVASHGCIETGAVVDLRIAAEIDKVARKTNAGISL